MTRPEMTAAPLSGNPCGDWRGIDDAELLAGAAVDAPGAVEGLVLRFGDRLCGFLVRIVRDRAWADDLTQEVFLRALAEANRYDERWPVRVWLFRIGRNLALDLLRRESSRHARDTAAAVSATVPAAVTTAEHREFQVALERALQQLPEGFRSVFLLRDGESLRYEEIAEVLGISVKTVSSRLHRARQQLRLLLEGHLQR